MVRNCSKPKSLKVWMYQAPFKVASMGIYKGILRNRNGFVGIRISKKDLEELKLM
jgi:hypothetical protein